MHIHPYYNVKNLLICRQRMAKISWLSLYSVWVRCGSRDVKKNMKYLQIQVFKTISIMKSSFTHHIMTLKLHATKSEKSTRNPVGLETNASFQKLPDLSAVCCLYIYIYIFIFHSLPPPLTPLQFPTLLGLIFLLVQNDKGHFSLL